MNDDATLGQEEDIVSTSSDQLVIVKVSEIYDGSNFCVNIPAGSAEEGQFADFKKLQEIEEQMKEFDEDVSYSFFKLV